MAGAISTSWSSEVLQRRLLLGLQRARTLLAVAIAIERKITTAEKWRIYRETDERMRRCIKGLRAYRHSAPDLWFSVLGALDCLPGVVDHRFFPGEAQQLCTQLCEVLDLLEDTTSGGIGECH